MGHVVGTDYLEPEVRWDLHEGGASGSYPDLDQFNRVEQSRWTAYHTSATDFYHVDLSYDENSNITWAEDGVHVGFDVRYVMDDVDRLTQAEEGSRSGVNIADRTRDQQWTLDQVGNWENDKLDLDGDGIFTGTGEWDDCREHNEVNEIVERNLDCDTKVVDFDYDAAGNLTDDGEDYKYVYDAFYRLREIRNRSTNDLISEHRYNGLGHRIAVHADTDDDGDVDGSDEWEHLVYDERWRLVANFWAGDADPHEEFLHHQAGLDGHGGSSYIDLVLLRDRDTNGDASLDERIYYCQNWRADVSALVSSDGEMLEWVKYSAYGVPFGLPAGDADSSGALNSTDEAIIATWAADPTYDVRGDFNLDGIIDGEDETSAGAEVVELGRGVLSGEFNTLGYAGYALEPGVQLYFPRYRNLDPVLGRWLQREHGGYGGGGNLYDYFRSSPASGASVLDLLEVIPGYHRGASFYDPDDSVRAIVADLQGSNSDRVENISCPGGRPASVYDATPLTAYSSKSNAGVARGDCVRKLANKSKKWKIRCVGECEKQDCQLWMVSANLSVETAPVWAFFRHRVKCSGRMVPICACAGGGPGDFFPTGITGWGAKVVGGKAEGGNLYVGKKKKK